MSKFKSRKKYEGTQTTGGDDTRRMKFIVGTNVIRIVEDNFEDAWVHYFKNDEGDKRRAICLGKGKCPLCGKKKKATHRFYFNIIDRKEQKETGETKIKVMEVGKMIYDQVRDLALDEEYGDPTQYNLKITRTGEGLKTKYSVRASNKQFGLTKEEEKVLEVETEDGGIYDLSFFVTKQSRSEILEMLGEEKGEKEEEEEEEIEEETDDGEEDEGCEGDNKSGRKNRKPKKDKEDIDEDEDGGEEELDIDKELKELESEDGEEEEEEEEKSKKKFKKKKKVTDEEGEDEDEDW